MYVFRVVVTTLMVIEMAILLMSGLKSGKSGKVVSMAMFALTGMGIVAIWG